jgi:hypothetical protein
MRDETLSFIISIVTTITTTAPDVNHCEHGGNHSPSGMLKVLKRALVRLG